MIDQMAPAEMREAAKRRRGDAGPRGTAFDDRQAQDERAGADALDRLADVIEYAERQMGPPAADWEHDPATILQAVARIARGSTTNHENRTGQ